MSTYQDELPTAVVAGLRQVASAITYQSSVMGRDATGGGVMSLTEAVMGTTAALVQIAHAIESLAEAVRDVRVPPVPQED